MKQIKILIYTFVISMLLDTTLSAVCSSDVDMSDKNIISTAKDKDITDDTLVTRKYAQSHLTGQQKTVKDIEGNVYKIGYFGHQVWMVENLRTTVYPNKDDIAHSKWKDGDSLSYSRGPRIDENGVADLKKEEKEASDSIIKETGLLYQWNAIMFNKYDKTINRGICMQGWHIPRKQDWLDFFSVLGGEEHASNGMKYTKFNANMVGGRMHNYEDDENKFYEYTKTAAYWSSTENGGKATRISIVVDSNKIQIEDVDTHYGLSVRCIKD
jgi:uncharacterized protein (TIGR02145 family)